MPLEGWHLEEGFGTEGSEGCQLIGSHRWRELFVYDPIYHWTELCISLKLQQQSTEASEWILTFHTAVAVLAEANCLAAPAFAFVAMAATGAGTKLDKPVSTKNCPVWCLEPLALIPFLLLLHLLNARDAHRDGIEGEPEVGV